MAFNAANATSNFFNQHWFTANRCIKRYTEKAIEEENNQKDPQKKADIGVHRKQLQIIDEAQRVYQKWISGEADGAQDRTAGFLQVWDQMMERCDQEPRIPLKCTFLWETFMEARASAASLIPFVEVLVPDTMRSMFPELVGKDTHLQQLQQKYVNLMIANILGSSMSSDEALEAMRSALQPFRQGARLEEIVGTVIAKDILIMINLVADSPEVASAAMVADLKDSISLIKGDDEKPLSDKELGPLLSQLRKFKRLGDAILGYADNLRKEMEKAIEITNKLKTMKDAAGRWLALDFWKKDAPVEIMAMTREYPGVCKDAEAPACVQPLGADVDKMLTKLHFKLLAQLLAAWTAQFGDTTLAPCPVLCGSDGFSFGEASAWCSELANAGRFECFTEAKFACEKLSAWFTLEPKVRAAKDDVKEVAKTDCKQLLELADFNPLKACEAKIRDREGVAPRVMQAISIDSVRMKFNQEPPPPRHSLSRASPRPDAVT